MGVLSVLRVSASIWDFKGPVPAIFENGNFIVSIHDSTAPSDAVDGVREGVLARQIMTAAHGDAYACFLPVPGAKSRSSDDSASILLKQLGGLINHEDRPCVGRHIDYWTYEVCGGRALRQFVPTEGSAEFSLGTYLADKDSLDSPVSDDT